MCDQPHRVAAWHLLYLEAVLRKYGWEGGTHPGGTHPLSRGLVGGDAVHRDRDSDREMG